MPDYDGDQTSIVYIVSSAQLVEANHLPFVFTDGHAIMYFSRYYSGCNNLHNVDWQIMRATYWMDTNDDNDRKRRRMAEFLVHDRFPLQLATELAVHDNKMAKHVGVILREAGISIQVEVKPQWYY